MQKSTQMSPSIIITHWHGKKFVKLKVLLVSHIHNHGAIVNQARVAVLIAQTIVVSF